MVLSARLAGLFRAAAAALLVAALPAAANPVKVAPVAAPGTAQSGRPSGFFEVGDFTVFFAQSPVGTELWRTDGSAAGTVLVKDIYPGPGSSNAIWPVVMGGVLYFAASGDDGVSRELWKSDGTAEGTVLVKDINPGPGSSLPTELTASGGLVYFSADDGVHGLELWVTDGTSAGTRMVKDIASGAQDSLPQQFRSVNGTVFFRASDRIAGFKLWKSDGTAAGTVALDYTGTCLTAFNGEMLLFSGDAATGTELFRSDGTPTGITLVRDIAAGSASSIPINAPCPVVIGSVAVFAANDGVATQLWKTDGTNAGTTLLATIDATGALPIRGLVGNGSVAYFTAGNAATGVELWKTDGTVAGTGPVADINPGTTGSSPQSLTIAGSAVYFTADDGTRGRELWRSEGTAATTALVKDIEPGAGSRAISGLTLAGSLFFRVAGAQGEELWVTDGTALGTHGVLDLYPGGEPGNAVPVAKLGSELVFPSLSSGSPTMMATDGTAAGTRALATFTGVPASMAEMVSAGSAVYFAATQSATGRELWRTDGTALGTTLVRDIAPGATSSFVVNVGLAPFGSSVLFYANDGNTGRELWISDGSEAGTYPLTDAQPGASSGVFQATPPPFVHNGVAYFSAVDTAGQEPWITNGTLPGTARLKDIYPANSSLPGSFASAGAVVYFTASDSVAGTELWKSDGSVLGTGTVRVADIAPGVASSSPSLPVAVGNIAFFHADDGVNGRELWKTDGTVAGTVMVANLTPGAGGTTFGTSSDGNLTDRRMVAFGNRVVFTASAASSGMELWQSDGTAAGTTMIADIHPGANSSDPRHLVALGGHVYFSAEDPVAGRELWRTDGTAAGTVRLADLVPGVGSSDPRMLFADGDRLWFQANDASGVVSLYRWMLETPADAVTLSPGLLTYGATPVGTNGSSQVITVTHTGSPAAALGAAGTAGDFSVVATTCGASLAPGGTCTFTIRFDPTALGLRSGTFSIAVGSGAPVVRTASLFGTGTSADTTPNAFSFADPAPVPLSSVVTSSPVQITGLAAPSPVTVIGGQYCLSSASGCACDVAAFTANPGTISNNQYACVRHTASAIPGGSTDTQLIVGGVGDTFTSVTQDPVPAPFVFVPLVNVPRASLQTSGSATISDINVSAPVTVVNGEYSIGCTGTFTQVTGSIANGQAVCVRHTAASAAATTNSTTLTIGGVSASFVTTTETPANPARLANISTRMQVLTGNDVLIGGFIIQGTAPKTVVVRARGPSLVPFGVTNALANPSMQLFSGQTVLATSDDWGTAPNAAALSSSGFAPSNPLESAILVTLNPGAYTAVVSGVGGTTGVGIIEVFEVDGPEVPLANISTRGQVLTGGDVMIGGFIIQGDAPQTVVVRARGPSLAPFGITNALQDPVLQLFAGQTVIATNDDWQSSPDAAVIQSSGFAPSDAKEAVIRITLPPGAYTAIVSGKNGTTGVGIIEVFAQ